MRIFVLTATYELRVSGKSHLRDHPRPARPDLDRRIMERELDMSDVGRGVVRVL
jgi:hypothetical protein